MPYEKDVQERQHWFCIKWYAIFPVPGICSGIRTAHKWCYNFAWVKETGYGLWSNLEGCENGKLFTWTKPSFNFFGSNTYPAGEMCFDSPRSSDSICDSSRTGLLASPLVGRPFVSNLDSNVSDLTSKIVETGTFEYPKGDPCLKGLWPWKKVLHKQVITATVAKSHVTVRWYIGGMPVTGNSGTISLSALCTWPFPLPKGYSETRVVQVKYEVIEDETKSTIKIFNNPADGSYSLGIGMSALVDVREYASGYANWGFSGETCDFDPQQQGESLRCQAKRLQDKIKQEKPSLENLKRPGPVVVFSEEIWKSIRADKYENVSVLLGIIANSYQVSPEIYTSAINQLEQETGLAGVSRLITIGSAEKGQKIVLQRE